MAHFFHLSLHLRNHGGAEMGRRRMTMRKIREIMRLRYSCKCSYSEISKSLGISKTTAIKCIKKVTTANISWPLPEGLDDEKLESILYKSVKKFDRNESRNFPDWKIVHQELKRKGVTRQTLWEEYAEDNPGAIQYSQYCSGYREWLKSQKISMHQTHKGGEKLFVDYCGKTIAIYDSQTNEVQQAQIFVAVWGASNYTYAEASLSQNSPSWISSHVRAFEYFDCVPKVIVPDNLKSGVTKVCKYDPDINPSYSDLAQHYDFVVLPARAYRPKDKAKAEAGVLLVTRWILAVLRNRKFFSLGELNDAIKDLLVKLNEKNFQKIPGSRKSHFEKLDLPNARRLPDQRYLYTHVNFCRVNVDYHIVVDDHFYSVPYNHRGKKVKVRISEKVIEVFFKNHRIAIHKKSSQKWKYTTIPEHMPSFHKQYAEWTPSRIYTWAENVGEYTRIMCEQLISQSKHPEQGFRRCLGLLRQGKRFGDDRVEKACERAFNYKVFDYKKVKSILEYGLENNLQTGKTENQKIVHHENIRGSQYYFKEEN